MDVSGIAHNDLQNVNRLAQLSSRDMTATLMSNLKYFNSKHTGAKILGKSVSFLTIWVVADLSTSSGRQTLRNALDHMVSISYHFSLERKSNDHDF